LGVPKSGHSARPTYFLTNTKDFKESVVGNAKVEDSAE